MAKNTPSNMLRLILKRKWFRMIESGIKLEDYREIKPFYIPRLKKKPTIVQFQLGYKKNCEQMTFEIQRISEYHPNTIFTIAGIEPAMDIQLRLIFGNSCEESWGSNKLKSQYVIRLGRRIS